MSEAELRAALDRVRRAARLARKRPAAEILDVLARVLDGFRAPDSSWRAALEAELPAASGFSAPMVRAGLSHALAPFSGAALHELVERELGGAPALDGTRGTLASGFETVAVLLAGALPSPTLPQLLLPLVLRSGVLAKTSRHDPVTARVVQRALAETDAGLAACLEVTSFPGSDERRSAALLEADCVVAIGADRTVDAVARRVRPPRRFVGHGHRVSFAALGPEAASDAALERIAPALALDVALWDQLGCLSPLAVFVQGGVGADRVARALAAALDRAEARWPRGAIEPEAAARFAQEREEAEFRRAAGGAVEVYVGEGGRWTLVREDGALLRPAPLHRFVRVHPVSGAAELLDALRPLGPHLAAVALDGFGGEQPALVRALADLGASRICAPGRLQCPPLGWHHDNQPLLGPLARFADVEPTDPAESPEGKLVDPC